MQVTAGFAEVNGTRLWFEQCGRGRPVVLIHGGYLDSRMWDDQVEALAARHRVIRYDVRGYGQSSPPSCAPYRYEDDLAGLLGYLGVDRAVIMGLSFGGRLAVDFALAYPAAVSALILAGSSLSGFPWSEDVPTLAREDAEASATCRAAGVEAARRLVLERHWFKQARTQPGVARRLERIVGDYPGWHWVHDDPVIAPDLPAYERLEAISAPTIAIVGELDHPDIHAITEALATRIPGARQATIPGVGHMVNMEAPEQFNQIVLNFLAGLPDEQSKASVGADAQPR